jgi:hypothetical protein
MKSLPISKKEFEDFSALQIMQRTGWWAVFSVSRGEKVWPFVCFGRTPEVKRLYIPLGQYPRLREVAQNFISNVDEKGGRFFIKREGVYGIKGENEPPETIPMQFINWKPDDSLARHWAKIEFKFGLKNFPVGERR